MATADWFLAIDTDVSPRCRPLAAHSSADSMVQLDTLRVKDGEVASRGMGIQVKPEARCANSSAIACVELLSGLVAFSGLSSSFPQITFESHFCISFHAFLAG